MSTTHHSGWLADQVAVVTGAGSGLGAAVVERYLREGAKGVVAVDREVSGLHALSARHPQQVLPVMGDVREHSVHEDAVQHALKRWGQLDILVANAGVYDFRRPLHSYSPQTLAQTLDEMLAINLRGYLYAAMAAREALLLSKGCVICTASVASFHAGGGGIVYTVAKHAVVGVVRQLALEFAPHVRVNGVGPGATHTRLRGTEALGHSERTIVDNPADFDRRISPMLPLGFAQHPDDHTGLYVLLASRTNARAVTGEIFMSDGGVGIRSA